MAMREEITVDELIARIADGLAMSCDGEYITKIANQVLIGEFTYLGDEQVVVEQKDMNHE